MKNLLFSICTIAMLFFTSCEKEQETIRNEENFAEDLDFYVGNHKNFTPDLKFSQKVQGTLNGASIDTDVWSALNSESGDAFSKVYNNGSGTDLSVPFGVILTYKCIIGIQDPSDVYPIASLINGKDYTRELTITFASGDQISTVTDASINSNNAITKISGSFPAQLLADYSQSKSVALENAANFLVKNIPNQGVMYSGIAQYRVGQNLYDVKIESKYLYQVGKPLNMDYTFTLESDYCYEDAANTNTLILSSKFQKSLQ